MRINHEAQIILTRVSHQWLTFFLGMAKGTLPKLKIKKAFKGPWGIKNKKKFNATLQWLLEEGHNKGCLEEMAQYQEHIEESPNPELFQKLLDYYPEKGIIAWDLCRLCNVATWGK